MFQKAFQISRKKFSCHIHLKPFGFNKVFDSCRDGKIWCRLNKLRYYHNFSKKSRISRTPPIKFCLQYFQLFMTINLIISFVVVQKMNAKYLNGVCIQFLPRGLPVLFAHFPSQMVYVFLTFKHKISIFLYRGHHLKS